MSTCRRCGQPGIKTPYGWGHVVNPANGHHYFAASAPLDVTRGSSPPRAASGGKR